MGMQVSEVFLFNLSNTHSKISFSISIQMLHMCVCCCCCCCCCVSVDGVGGFSINLCNKQWKEKIEEALLFVCLRKENFV